MSRASATAPPVWDEDTLKVFHKSVKSLIPTRDLMWRKDVVGIFDADFLAFIKSKDEFLSAEVLELVEPLRQYLSLAQSKLIRPALTLLRGVQVGPLPWGACNAIFVPVLAVLGSLFLFAKHLSRPTRNHHGKLYY
jgi:hypothetical protein